MVLRSKKRTVWVQLGVHALWLMALAGMLLTQTHLVAWSLLLATLGFWGYAVLHNHMHVPLVQGTTARLLVSRSRAFSCGFPYRGYGRARCRDHRCGGSARLTGRLLARAEHSRA